jgi:hypothetical protein
VNISKLYHILGTNHSMFYVWNFQVSFPYNFLVLKMLTLLFTKYMWKTITFHCLPSLRCKGEELIVQSRESHFIFIFILHTNQGILRFNIQQNRPEILGVTSRTSRSLDYSRFPYVFHRLVVSCKFRSIFFAKFVWQIWTSSLHDIFT